MELETSTNQLEDSAKEINGWFSEAFEEQERLALKRSQLIGVNNPFAKNDKNVGDGEEVLGPNSIIRIKKSQLDHLLNSLKENQAELNSLKQKVQ